MRLFSAILLLLVVAGCAQQPLRVNTACALLGTSDSVLLTVTPGKGDSSEHLILHSQLHIGVDGDELEYVALNPVGAQLFTGSLRAGLIDVQAAPFYRGADAATLIWAYNLWQQRDRAQTCWPDGNRRMTQQPGGELVLSEGKHPVAIWRPLAPQAIELPGAGLRINLRVMD